MHWGLFSNHKAPRHFSRPARDGFLLRRQLCSANGQSARRASSEIVIVRRTCGLFVISIFAILPNCAQTSFFLSAIVGGPSLSKDIPITVGIVLALECLMLASTPILVPQPDGKKRPFVLLVCLVPFVIIAAHFAHHIWPLVLFFSHVGTTLFASPSADWIPMTYRIGNRRHGEHCMVFVPPRFAGVGCGVTLLLPALFIISAEQFEQKADSWACLAFVYFATLTCYDVGYCLRKRYSSLSRGLLVVTAILISTCLIGFGTALTRIARESLPFA